MLTREETPQEWAIAHRELATAYETYLGGDLQANRAQAREHSVEAQAILSRTTSPKEWGIMHYNQGLIFFLHTSRTLEADAEQALEHFRKAMTILTPEVTPAHYRRIQMARALMLERLERWEDAYEALLRAREVQRDLVAAAASEQSRDEAIAETMYTDMYVRTAQVLLRLTPANPTEAAIALEEGRAQSMRAALDLDNYAPEQVRNPEARTRLDAFLAARNLWRKRQHEAIEPLPEDLAPGVQNQRHQERTQALQAAYTEFVNARAAIRLHDDPDFMTPVPTLEGIARCLSGPEEALVYLAAGSYMAIGPKPITGVRIVDGSSPGMAVIVVRGIDGTPQVQAINLPELTINTTDMLLPSTSNQRPHSLVKLGQAGQTSSKLGLDELASVLYERGVRRVTLVPYGRLGLFPFPAVPVRLPEKPVSYFGDLFELTVAPSARAAEIARARATALTNTRPLLFIGGNPQPPAYGSDLPFSTAEADTVHHLGRALKYPAKQLHYLAPREMTRPNVLAGLKGATYAHLALHGFYNVAEPRRSQLILAHTDNAPSEQCTISLGEILDSSLSNRVDLHALRLLVLSACETSKFDTQRLPNEVIGLAAGFLQAGAAGVIASLWKVDDEATYLLMTHFARLYLDPQRLWSPAKALALAQRWLREEATNWVLQNYEPLPPGMTIEANPALAGLLYDHQSALKHIRQKAAARVSTAPDGLPYANPRYWAAFIVTGC